jgi:hypothetical protein
MGGTGLCDVLFVMMIAIIGSRFGYHSKPSREKIAAMVQGR